MIHCFSDIAALARAAVSGDESALDMFNWKQKGKSSKLSSVLGSSEAMSFYVGSNNGTAQLYRSNAHNIHCVWCVGSRAAFAVVQTMVSFLSMIVVMSFYRVLLI